MTGSVSLAIPGIAAAGLGFANIWPMLFSITVKRSRSAQTSSAALMCTAISGGALLPLLTGWFLDPGWKEIAFIVPVLCFVYLLILSLQAGRKLAATARPLTIED